MDITNNITEIIIAIVLSLSGIAIGIQILVKNWKNSNTESNFLNIMHKELERMNGQNSFLYTEIVKLQQELINLNSQLVSLTIENQKLRVEISNLDADVARLNILLRTNANSILEK